MGVRVSTKARSDPLCCAGAMDPDIAESFANTLRINKFIAGVSNREDGQGSPTPTVDAVVLAMNERLKGMQQQLSERDADTGLSSSSPQHTQIVAQNSQQSPISRTQPTSSSQSHELGAATPESSLIQKVSAMIDQRLSSGMQSGEVQFGTAEVRRLYDRLQEQSHQIEELSAAVVTASNKADDAEVTLETVVQEMDSMRPSQGNNQLSFSGQRQLESNLLSAVDAKVDKLRLELGEGAGLTNLSRDGVEGITEALQRHWDQQFDALERKLSAEIQGNAREEKLQREALANRHEEFILRFEERFDLLESRVSRLEEGHHVDQDIDSTIEAAVAQVRQEARWAQDEAIRIRVEEERRQLHDLQQLRRDVNDQIEALANKLNEQGGGHTGLHALEQELKAAHQASLRALEAKGKHDFQVLEEKTGECTNAYNC